MAFDDLLCPTYLTGVATPATDNAVYDPDTPLPLGLLIQPRTAYLLNKTQYTCCAVDNDCFTEAGRARFDADAYLNLISACNRKWGDYVLFATAPDVVGNWAATLASSLPFLPRIRNAGDGFMCAALVLQDGATLESVPFDAFDCLFIGGSTDFKLSHVTRRICHEARRRGKWVHMGRVNSLERLAIAKDFRCDSVDGTCLRFEQPEPGLLKVWEWLIAIDERTKAEDTGLFGDIWW
jgi:hypothetical protein